MGSNPARSVNFFPLLLKSLLGGLSWQLFLTLMFECQRWHSNHGHVFSSVPAYIIQSVQWSKIVQTLKIQEGHPVKHSSACNFCHFFLPVLSRPSFTSRTPKDRNTSTFCSFKSYNPETFMSSTATTFVHDTHKHSQKVPCAKVAHLVP